MAEIISMVGIISVAVQGENKVAWDQALEDCASKSVSHALVFLKGGVLVMPKSVCTLTYS